MNDVADAVMRGFMTARGLPDNPRSSRYILKDFVDGKRLFCSAPPGVDQRHFSELNAGAAKRAAEKAAPAPTPLQLRVTRVRRLHDFSHYLLLIVFMVEC